jgi:hypothetical protein
MFTENRSDADPDGHRVYAFLPTTHRAAVFADLA